jgi:hypothetical protein
MTEHGAPQPRNSTLEPCRLSGGCWCGAVGYAVTDAFEYGGVCHCSQCRRGTGSAFKPYLGIRHEELQLSPGAGQILTFGDEGQHDERCARCGSLLYSVVRDGAYVHVAMGSLLDSPTMRPNHHMFVASKADWDDITDNLPQFAEYAA